jgi:hypothetical protein
MRKIQTNATLTLFASRGRHLPCERRIQNLVCRSVSFPELCKSTSAGVL